MYLQLKQAYRETVLDIKEDHNNKTSRIINAKVRYANACTQFKSK